MEPQTAVGQCVPLVGLRILLPVAASVISRGRSEFLRALELVLVHREAVDSGVHGLCSCVSQTIAGFRERADDHCRGYGHPPRSIRTLRLPPCGLGDDGRRSGVAVACSGNLADPPAACVPACDHERYRDCGYDHGQRGVYKNHDKDHG